MGSKVSGDYDEERIRALVVERLIQTGWRDRIRDSCFLAYEKRAGVNTSVDDIVNEMLPLAKGTVPATVKSELLEHVRLVNNRKDRKWMLLCFSTHRVRQHNSESQEEYVLQNVETAVTKRLAKSPPDTSTLFCAAKASIATNFRVAIRRVFDCG